MMDNKNRVVYFQGRIDKKLENIKRKINDDLIKLNSTPEDIILLRIKTNEEGDPTSYVIKEIKIGNIIFPKISSLSIKKISKEFHDSNEDGYVINQLVESFGKSNDQKDKNFSGLEIQVPYDLNIDIGDVIVRVFVDSPKMSTVVLYKVNNLLADFSNNSVLSIKAVISILSENINILDSKEFKDTVIDLSKRRLSVGY